MMSLGPPYDIYVPLLGGPAIDQAASCRLFTAETWVHSKGSLRSGTATGCFPRNSGYRSNYHITNATYSFVYVLRPVRCCSTAL